MIRPISSAAITICAAAMIESSVRSADSATAKDPHDRSSIPIEVQPADAKAAKIVLISADGGASHPLGDHEHFAGCAMFYRLLQQTPGVAPVMVKDGWPSNPDTLKNAR